MRQKNVKGALANCEAGYLTNNQFHHLRVVTRPTTWGFLGANKGVTPMGFHFH